ncbi:MAG: GntR family transcriptional regulator [Candidatus Nanopelagicales bacterium]
MSGQRAPSLREQVGDQLRAALMSGELRPGVTYTVRSMAAEHGVSPTPFREAILDLAGEGLLQVRPNRGFSVVQPDTATVVHIANVRRLLEIPATVEVARRASEQELAGLLDSAERTAVCATRGDLAGYIEADQDFHRDVLALTGNPVLTELSERLRAQARMHAFPGLLKSGELLRSAQEHLALVRSMADGDVPAVREIVGHHINYALMALTQMEPVDGLEA